MSCCWMILKKHEDFWWYLGTIKKSWKAARSWGPSGPTNRIQLDRPVSKTNEYIVKLQNVQLQNGQLQIFAIF